MDRTFLFVKAEEISEIKANYLWLCVRQVSDIQAVKTLPDSLTTLYEIRRKFYGDTLIKKSFYRGNEIVHHVGHDIDKFIVL